MQNIQVQRSVFGGITPNFATNEGINQLRQRGFALPEFANATGLKPVKDRLEFGIRRLLENIEQFPQGFIGSLDQLASIYTNVSGVLVDCLVPPVEGADFMGREPRFELPKLVDILIESRSFNYPLVPIVAPVCPDDSGIGYRVGKGVGPTATKVLESVKLLRERIFKPHGFELDVAIELADVEADDPLILYYTKEGSGKRHENINATLAAIRARIDELGIGDYTRAEMMSERFGCVHDYQKAQDLAVKFLLMQRRINGNPQITSTIERLLVERKKIGDFDGMSPEFQDDMVIMELAGYMAYGTAVGGKSLILTPDAMSAVPAYNFGLKASEVNPVIYLRRNLAKKGII